MGLSAVLREGKIFLSLFFGLTIFFFAVNYVYPLRVFMIMGSVCLGLLIYTLYFLRYPKRKTQQNDQVVYASADGYVMNIEENVEEDSFIGGKAHKITIFMHLFSMHWNLCPIQGEITYLHHQKGQFKNALNSLSWKENEHQKIGIQNQQTQTKILVIMISGMIARKIRCLVQQGIQKSQGEILGLIKYGSANIIYVPNHLKIVVKKGDKMRAGISILASK